MIEGIRTIIGFLEEFWQLISNTIESAGTAISVMLTASVIPRTVPSFVPGIIGSSAVITAALTIVKVFIK